MAADIKEIALELLRDCFNDEIAYLQIKMRKDKYIPQLEHMQRTSSELFEDIFSENSEAHELIETNKAKRIELLKSIIRGETEYEEEEEWESWADDE